MFRLIFKWSHIRPAVKNKTFLFSFKRTDMKNEKYVLADVHEHLKTFGFEKLSSLTGNSIS